MGQSQFLPSSFQQFAVDHDGDGRRDIWETLPDVFASAANYLARAGWKHDQTWGRQVRLPEGFDADLTGLASGEILSTRGRPWAYAAATGTICPPGRCRPPLILPGGAGWPRLSHLSQLPGAAEVEPVALLRDHGRTVRRHPVGAIGTRHETSRAGRRGTGHRPETRWLLLGAEKVPLLDALHRVSAEAVNASRDIPLGDNSAMDGYAVRHADVAGFVKPEASRP